MRSFLLFAAAALAAACGGRDWRVRQLYGGPTSLDVLGAPQTVEAFRVDPRPSRDVAEAKRVGDFPVTAGPVAVDAATAAELSSILLDPETYDWLRTKGCVFRPGVGFRFTKDASRVDLVLCFDCDELMIFRRGSFVGIEDFDAARPRLVAIAKRLFPGDEKVQALK